MSFEIPLTPASHTLSRGTPPTKLDLPAVVPLDEPPTNGITIQPPTALLQDARPTPVEKRTKYIRPKLETLPSIDSTLNVSPSLGGHSSRSGTGSCSGSGSGSGSAMLSPSIRHPLTRPLSPDLPTRDALYLFSNFSSYMRSPNEGPQGITGNEDFKDTVRLLDFARTLVAQPNLNVHILHLKYRFQSSTEARQSTYSSGDRQLPVNWVDARGRLRNPVPQPFSVARDPVLKIDYQENGVFMPLPAQAIFSHISKACYPPPRLIVASFVNSMVTQNHISQLATWALTCSPPCYILSPLETRIRIIHPIQYTLHHAIPMSMYAQPGAETITSPFRPSPTRSVGGGGPPFASKSSSTKNEPDPKRRYSDSCSTGRDLIIRSPGGRVYPSDPIASLTIVSTPVPDGPGGEERAGAVPPKTASSMGTNAQKSYLQSDRIPLWALAPGMNVLQGSTSASIGIRLSDFSALNLVNHSETKEPSHAIARAGFTGQGQGRGKGPGGVGFSKSSRTHHTGEVWVDSSPIQAKHRILVPPVEPISRPSTPAAIDNLSNTGSGSDARSTHRQHLTPPERFTPPDIFHSRLSPSLANANGDGNGSFPRLARIPHWRRGRKELAEDVLEELGKGLELDGVLEEMRNLGLWDMEHNLHVDRIRRASEMMDGALVEYMDPNGKRQDKDKEQEGEEDAG